MGRDYANIITGFRILGSIVMLFLPTFSAGFYTMYILCGLSDVLDGIVARRMGCASKSGSRFDTIADHVFVIISLIKLLPELGLPPFVWTWIVIIAVVKLFNMVSGTAIGHDVFSYHSGLNKLTGVLFFILPFTIGIFDVLYGSIIVCTVATISAAVEAAHMNMLPPYDGDVP